MDSDALDTCLFCTSVHFSVEIGFCDGKDAVGWLHGVQAFDVILHFIAQKRWHLNHAVTLGCLGADPQPLSRQRDERVADRAGRMPAVSAGRRAEDRGLHGTLPRAAQPSAEGPCGGLSQGTRCCLDFPTFSLDCQPFCGCSPLSILPYRPKPGTTVPGFCALWRNLA